MVLHQKKEIYNLAFCKNIKYILIKMIFLCKKHVHPPIVP